jgi:hypothetical protein
MKRYIAASRASRERLQLRVKEKGYMGITLLKGPPLLNLLANPFHFGSLDEGAIYQNTSGLLLPLDYKQIAI